MPSKKRSQPKFGEVFRDKADDEVVMTIGRELGETNHWVLVLANPAGGARLGWPTYRDLGHPDWEKVDDAE